MSIPQICPNCENHISTAHAPGCCYSTVEYAHLGWPSTKVEPITMTPPTMEEMSKDGFVDSASAIRRLLAYLKDEPDEEIKDEVAPQELAYKSRMLFKLNAKSEELRKEAAGMYNIEARAKRNFAADVLDALVEEIA